jgi:Holliday junction resolvase RusA-like endonuclease
MTGLACAFTVPGEPVPCGRPRSRIVTPYGKAPFIQTYPDPKSDAYEKAVGLVARASRPTGWRTDWAAYEVRIRVFQALRRGDADNLAKAPIDGCQGVLWDNDRRIRKLVVEVADDLVNPRLEVLATMLGDLTAEADARLRTKAMARQRRAVSSGSRVG